MVNQTGYADEGDVIQVARDYVRHDHHYGDHRGAANLGGDDSEDPDSGNGTAAKAGGGIGAIIAVIVIAYLIFGDDEPFPAVSDAWPAGVTQEAVGAKAAAWLDNCAKSASATPANCPQSVMETSDVSKVHWAFYGDPVGTTDIKFDESASLFDVYGSLVVVADYTVSRTSKRIVTPTTYWAKIAWSASGLDVKEIKEHSAIGDPDLAKVDPKLPFDWMKPKVKDAFARCLRGAKLQMPAGCPEWAPPSGAEKVKWSASGDPLLTARATWDPKFGIYHVKGTYGLDVRYRWIGTTKTESRNPTYDAWVAPSPTGPVVLQIKDADSV